MLILEREQTDARVICTIALNGSKYSEPKMLEACQAPMPHHSSCIENIVGQPGVYKVSIKTGYEPQDNIFAEMVREYGKA